MDSNPGVHPISPEIREENLEVLGDEGMDFVSQNAKRNREETASPTSDSAEEIATSNKAKAVRRDEETMIETTEERTQHEKPEEKTNRET